MKVIFYPDYIESVIYDVPDDITEDALYELACNWVAENVGGFWKVVQK